MRTKVSVLIGLVLAVVVGASGTAQGQDADEEWAYAPHERYVQANLPRLERAYLHALEFPIEGIVESALREVARIKIEHLEWEVGGPDGEPGEIIAGDGLTPAIRYKASLVKALFETPALFATEGGRIFALRRSCTVRWLEGWRPICWQGTSCRRRAFPLCWPRGDGLPHAHLVGRRGSFMAILGVACWSCLQYFTWVRPVPQETPGDEMSAHEEIPSQSDPSAARM